MKDIDAGAKGPTEAVALELGEAREWVAVARRLDAMQGHIDAAMKRVECLFLADDLESLGSTTVAEWIRNADTDEEVEQIRKYLLRMLEGK